MTIRLKLCMGTLTAVLLGGMMAPEAKAQCGGPLKTRMMMQNGSSGARLVRAGMSTQTEDQWGETPGASGMEAIVGVWKTDFEDPAHGYSDKGYQTWHSDYTEMLNSGRPPSMGSICEGVWAKVGRSTYQLNHFAMAFNDGVHFTTLYQFHETVQVDPFREPLFRLVHDYGV